MSKYEEKYEDRDLRQLGKAFSRLRDRHSELKDQAAAVQREIDYLRFEAIPNLMEETGTETILIKDVGRLGTRVEASAKVTDKEKLYAWLRENDAEAMIGETVNSSSLKAFIMGRIRDGETIPDSTIIEFKPFTMATLTKG